MSEAKKRKVHTPEFKAKVGLEALRGMKTINEIGQDHGVHPVQIGLWKKEIQEQAKTLFEGKRGPRPMAEHKEPERLYSEIGRLKVELDWLKKSPGSACHDEARLDRNGRSRGGSGSSSGGGTGSTGGAAGNEDSGDAAMRTGRDITRHGLRAPEAESDRSKRLAVERIDRPGIHPAPVLR